MAAGLDILFDTPEYNLINPGNHRSKVGQAKMGDIPQLEQGNVLLDEAGMSDLYYKSVNGLRDFAVQAKQMYGVDVFGAPDFSNPKDREIRQLWQQGLSQHGKNAEHLAQGRDNQKALMKAVLEGKRMLTAEGRKGGQFIDERNIQQVSFDTNPAFLKNHNAVLKRQPKNQADADAMEMYREAALQEIDERQASGEFSEEAASFYKSQIGPAGNHDDRLTQSKLETEKARRGQIHSSTRLNNARIKDLLDKKQNKGSGKGAKGAAVVRNRFPQLSEIVNFAMNPRGQDRNVGPGNANQGALAGLSGGQIFYGGDKKAGFQFERMSSDAETGDQYMIFSKALDETEAIKQGTDRLEQEVLFTAEDVTPAIKAIMGKSDYKDFLKFAESNDLLSQDGKLPASKVNEAFGMGNERRVGTIDVGEFSEGELGQIKQLSAREFYEGFMKLDPNLSDDDLTRLWNLIHDE